MTRIYQSVVGAVALAAVIAAGAAFAQSDPEPVDPAGPPVMDEPSVPPVEDPAAPPVMDADEPAQEPALLNEAGEEPLSASPFIEYQAANELLATEFLGRPVFNTAAENLGAIDNLLISIDGQLTGIVVGVGGFLGIGEKKVAIDIGAVQLMVTEEGETRYIVDLGRTALENAPDFHTFVDQQADIEAGNITEEPVEEAPAE